MSLHRRAVTEIAVRVAAPSPDAAIVLDGEGLHASSLPAGVEGDHVGEALDLDRGKGRRGARAAAPVAQFTFHVVAPSPYGAVLAEYEDMADPGAERLNATE